MSRVFHGRLAALLTLCTILGWPPSPAGAQELICDGTSEFPCAFDIRNLALQKVPPTFQFQTRIAQVKLPSGDAILDTVLVKLIANSKVVCTELFKKVQVKGNVLNLTVGQAMDCEMEEVIAENENLLFQVCVGGESGCLKPVPLAATPYAVKVSYASEAMQADRAAIAGHAVWAQRATADREHFRRKGLGLGAGYFDFYTHVAADAVPGLFESEEGYAPYSSGGFIQWCPVRDTGAKALHIVGKDEGSGQITPLTKLVLAATTTTARGDLTVGGAAGGTGLVVTSNGMHVMGDSDFTGPVDVTMGVTVEGSVEVTGDAKSGGFLVAEDSMAVAAGGIHVAADAIVDALLSALGGLALSSGLVASANGSVSGLLTVGTAVAELTLDVLGEAGATLVEVGWAAVAGQLGAGDLSIAGPVELEGDLSVEGALDVAEPVVFHGLVTFKGGTSYPNEAADLTYVQALNEERKLTFGGPLTFGAGTKHGSDLDVMANKMIDFRVQTAAAAPVACSAAAEGFFYFDTVKDALLVCADGEYVDVSSTSKCGNSFVEPGEKCDDGNTAPGDGCSKNCKVEGGWSCTPIGVQPSVCQSCGDGKVTGSETCDDGDIVAGDGCSSSCSVEDGWKCAGTPSTCQTTCGDNKIAGDELCDDGNTNAGDGCSASCAAVENGWTCSGVPSLCVGVCGDGAVVSSEVCDDGNLKSGDGCSSKCATEAGWACSGAPSVCDGKCGDGALKGTEKCDDENTADGDGCSSACAVEIGWTCSGAPSTCGAACGDGLLKGDEKCDDGNKMASDGCSPTCTVETGWSCAGSPSVCLGVCGDGQLKAGEKCDDANKVSGDGCSSSCTVESGWECFGSPSKCNGICGDGQKKGSETCDDGNYWSGDGCSSSCKVESGWSCSGSPSKCTNCTGTKYGGHCYWKVSWTTYWSTARSYCQSQYGGYLVAISNQAENNFITGFVPGTIWIGAYQPYGSSWAWVSESGQYWSPYTGWGPGEPNNYGGNEDCGVLLRNSPYGSNGKWNDATCSSGPASYFVCEKNL